MVVEKELLETPGSFDEESDEVADDPSELFEGLDGNDLD